MIKDALLHTVLVFRHFQWWDLDFSQVPERLWENWSTAALWKRSSEDCRVLREFLSLWCGDAWNPAEGFLIKCKESRSEFTMLTRFQWFVRFAFHFSGVQRQCQMNIAIVIIETETLGRFRPRVYHVDSAHTAVFDVSSGCNNLMICSNVPISKLWEREIFYIIYSGSTTDVCSAGLYKIWCRTIEIYISAVQHRKGGV